MSSNPSDEGKAFAEFLRNLAPEARAESNRRSAEKAEAEYERFKAAFGKAVCSICGGSLGSFNKECPCLHWLLRPAGFTKWHFEDVTREFRFFQIQSYLRWVANQEAIGQNINDLRVEGTGKLVELTIRYKDYEWAFSCGDNDYAGHKDAASPEAQKPHYHFQMRVKKAAFIRYNDFHVPFHDMDIIEMEAMRAAPEFIKHSFIGGEGMSDLLDEDMLERVVQEGIILPSNADNAPIKLDSIVMADEGSTISGDDLAELLAEAKQKGVTIASLLHKLPNAKVQTIVTPGPGVVEQAPRSGRASRG